MEDVTLFQVSPPSFEDIITPLSPTALDDYVRYCM
jgi:hypothetical protein